LLSQEAELLIIDNEVPPNPHMNSYRQLVLTSPKPAAVTKFTKQGKSLILYLPSLLPSEQEAIFRELYMKKDPKVTPDIQYDCDCTLIPNAISQACSCTATYRPQCMGLEGLTRRGLGCVLGYVHATCTSCSTGHIHR
jgi:hypothetical protein